MCECTASVAHSHSAATNCWFYGGEVRQLSVFPAEGNFRTVIWIKVTWCGNQCDNVCTQRQLGERSKSLSGRGPHSLSVKTPQYQMAVLFGGLSITIATWLILPVVICLSQRLSHACLSISIYTVKLRTAHYISYSFFDSVFLHGYLWQI